MMHINVLHNNPKNQEDTMTWKDRAGDYAGATGSHIKRHKWKYGLGLGAAVLAAGMGYFMWQARDAPVQVKETTAVTSTAVAGQRKAAQPTVTQTAATETTGTAYDSTTTMETTTMAPNVSAPATTGGIEAAVEKGAETREAMSSDAEFLKQFGFEKKYVDLSADPDKCQFGPYISVMQRADIEDSVIRSQLTAAATPTAPATSVAPAPAGQAGAPAAATGTTQTTATTVVTTAPATGYTYTIGGKEFKFKTPSQYLSPGTIVFHDGDKAFHTPVATMQQGEKGTPMYTSLDQIMDAERKQVTKRGVFATPFDAELKSNVTGVYTTSVGDGQSVEFTSHEGKVRLSKRFNTEQVYKAVGDNVITADELKQLGAKDLLVVYEIDRGDQSVLTGGMFTYVNPTVAGTLPDVTSSKAPVYEMIKTQRSATGVTQAAEPRAADSAQYRSSSTGDAVETVRAPQLIEQRVKPAATTVVGNVVGDVTMNGSDAQPFNVISPRDAYGWATGTQSKPAPVITQESFDKVAKDMYLRAPSIPAGVYNGN